MMNRLVFFALAGLAGAVACWLITSCQPKGQRPEKEPGDTLALTPEESLRRIQVEEGFAVKLVAAEPLVSTPVALSFDEKGRMWVVEMQGYMPDTEGTGESQPSGRIVILEDRDRDGAADERKVFMDSLVLPRAICLVENGILVAEPPALWFVEIEEDRPGKKTLVDSAYAAGGNPESQPNGLLRGLDNWIYSAGSDKRYRKNGGQWLIEKTHLRGQWGITLDDRGRLYYNNNSRNLLGDYFTPGLGAGNSRQRTVAGFNENIVPDNRVYPTHPTPGVNRGYREGILDDSLRLVKFTAACGPVLYRGDLFGETYYGDAFVAEPAANLIKRNILQENGNRVSGRQAWKGKEFLSSTDERFRPVSLYNGPDGALYIVDMYRGIIQHKDFLTDYLKDEIRNRQLARPLRCGRIYKIVPAGSRPRAVEMPSDPRELVTLLGHPNGWVRSKAQQLLTERRGGEVIPLLRQRLEPGNRPLLTVHALWTLEGLHALTPADLSALLERTEWMVRMQALSALPAVLNEGSYRDFLPALETILQRKDSLAAPYVAFLAKDIGRFDREAADRLLRQAAFGFPENEYVAGAVISNLEGREAAFLRELAARSSGARPAAGKSPGTEPAVAKDLKKILRQMKQLEANKKNDEAMKEAFPKGYALYSSLCQACHGSNGNGVKSLAPPLNGSEWVTGDPRTLAAIVLYGLTGPVRVKGTLYTDQEVSGDMPGIGQNGQLDDATIAELLSFIRHSWSNRAGKVDVKALRAVRERYGDRQKAFTAPELAAAGKSSAASRAASSRRPLPPSPSLNPGIARIVSEKAHLREVFR